MQESCNIYLTRVGFLQAFVENRDASGMMPWIVDVRDIGRAHVRAAEVRRFFLN